LAAYVLLVTVPLLLGLGHSLAYSLGLTGLLAEGFHTGAWSRLAAGEGPDSFLYTLALTALSLVLALGFGYGAAWWTLFGREGRRLYPWLFVPLAMAPVVAAFAVFVWAQPAGILSRLAHAAGLTEGVRDFPRLVQDAGSVGILAAHTLLVGPVFAIVFRQQAEAERMAELRQVARGLGAGTGAFLRHVFVPVIWRRSGAFVLLYGIYLFGTYEVPLLLGRSHPRAVTVYITDQLTRFDLAAIPVAHAAAAAYALIVLAMVARLLTRWNRQLLDP
jgi:putative spermidine/putrescine transport system permease protein